MIYQFNIQTTGYTHWFNTQKKQGDIFYLIWTHLRINNWYKIIDNYGNFELITLKVNKWLKDNDITFPFENDEDRILFELTF